MLVDSCTLSRVTPRLKHIVSLNQQGGQGSQGRTRPRPRTSERMTTYTSCTYTSDGETGQAGQAGQKESHPLDSPQRENSHQPFQQVLRDVMYQSRGGGAPPS
ncbi:hypothetical protein V3481_017879 [Fusarium oxysporum f. sp. vasinfectum]